MKMGILKNLNAEPNRNHQVLVMLAAVFSYLLMAALFASTKSDRDEGPEPAKANRLLVMTVVNDPNNEGFVRFNRSVEAYKLDLVVLDTSKEKINEELTNSGAVKIGLLRKALANYRNEQDLVIMVVDSSNLIVNGNKRDILSRFQKFNPESRIVFCADSICRPDPSLELKYPTGGSGNRFLNSGAFIGYAQALWDMLSISGEFNLTDGQLFYTQVYLDTERQQKLAIELDHRSELFQSLDAKENEQVELEFGLDKVRLINLAFQTRPVVALGNNQTKVMLNSLGNYLGKAWTVKDGCRYCNESLVSLFSLKDSELPIVLMGLFIEEPTPFLEYFFENILKINYPKSRIHLLIHNSVSYHVKEINRFLEGSGSKYASKQLSTSFDEPFMLEWQARNMALSECKRIGCDHYLSLDSVARLELPDTLRILIETNKTMIAPLLSRPRKLWSNFWGSITNDGYYARSHDYVDLVTNEREGIWNVPHVMYAYLLDGHFIKASLDGNNEQSAKLTYFDERLPLKSILTFSHQLRSMDVFQYVLNTHDFGHLVDPTSYDTNKTHPDFHQLINNMLDWEQKYLHENYSQLVEEEIDDENSTKLRKSSLIEEPCQDVFWFPLVNDLFCQQLIDIMQKFGQWSGGINDDPRIQGGYESVPTRDIHMKQVGLHEMWLTFLHEYVMPIQLREYIGYEHNPPRADLAFVVRYHPSEQPSLRAHHDSSTYTLNIALNSPGKDYTGGGCRFVRYNCSVIDSRRGWALIHPGRLTHYHEGLPVTNGTRYIMVTFVDP